ncbi:Uncharacterized membrane protein YheB, UPF0754 family [Fontibacillus panacisegetis]|uniref:Uncharacterized membrane protein YheB, UPF0754 family n=1 Tax=Fontibacillus panacisegetis TaxID=670482 RepID=A0A1G7K666_9BACL|nr:DUF445 family protein [Fontibacillus panacisegetis]SDF32636.1 Uncharacterized membrane protein YheB, UPF0754 family [Fontibacillus panacisegetis]
MDDWLYILVSVLVAGFVGGITNHYAIKMLFHPRKSIYIGKLHVPFTPGLIPKRRDDIAVSLGNVVAEYLVTTEGLQEMVSRPAFRNKAEEYLRGLLHRLNDSPLTLKEVAHKFWDQEEWQSVKLRLADGLRLTAAHGVSIAWHKFNLNEVELQAIVPGWNEDNTKRWSEAAADAVLGAVEEEILSAEGQRMLTTMATGMMDQAGGFLGTMAAIFVDEDKMVRKITPAIVRALRSDDARSKIVQVIQQRLHEYGDKPAAELLELLTGEESQSWITGKIANLPMEKWIESVEGVKVSSLIAPWKEQAEAGIPAMTARALQSIAKGIPTAVQAIQLPELVKEQVEKFPVERLEEIILNISGKEFRAITWLGVLLGGFIGLLQSLFMLWWG